MLFPPKITYQANDGLFLLHFYARRVCCTLAAVHAEHLYGTSAACVFLFPDIQHHKRDDAQHRRHPSFSSTIRSVVRLYSFTGNTTPSTQETPHFQRVIFLIERSNKPPPASLSCPSCSSCSVCPSCSSCSVCPSCSCYSHKPFY